MTTDTIPSEQGQKKSIIVQQSADAVYGIGLFGAWAYYIGRAATTEEKVKGFLKGFIWPAILVYELLQFFNKETE
jgi:hypothetical protein